ncbi:hypothetical protein FHS94_003139 [Sphingomonas aerophila]|jgi:hypothetical protein|uniref:Uncharacterized protein n=1 Tax=Sphingomonas aerophila TaxID=1344948 RepID=A0A7W9BG76_9SPHN|nr:hypothetical protein [Sphingomonas aerophila]
MCRTSERRQPSRHPCLRFNQRKAGHKGSGAVMRFGEQLLPNSCEHLSRLQRWEALATEAVLADA